MNSWWDARRQSRKRKAILFYSLYFSRVQPPSPFSASAFLFLQYHSHLLTSSHPLFHSFLRNSISRTLPFSLSVITPSYFPTDLWYQELAIYIYIKKKHIFLLFSFHSEFMREPFDFSLSVWMTVRERWADDSSGSKSLRPSCTVLLKQNADVRKFIYFFWFFLNFLV